MAVAHGLKGGVVPIPRWILAFRALQLLLAILILALTAHSLSVFSGGPLKGPLISTLIISILTILPILALTTPLHLAQRRVYDPRIALLLDGLSTVYWIATFAALASYVHIFRGYGLDRSIRSNDQYTSCFSCRRAWRTAVAATVLSAVMFLLSLFTTLAFIYYYHCHLANFPALGLPRGGQKASGTGEIGTISAPIRDGEEHQMSSIATQTIPRTAPRADDAYTGNATTGQFNNPSQPTHIPQSLPQGTYPSHEVGSHEGYGASPARI